MLNRDKLDASIVKSILDTKFGKIKPIDVSVIDNIVELTFKLYPDDVLFKFDIDNVLAQKRPADVMRTGTDFMFLDTPQYIELKTFMNECLHDCENPDLQVMREYDFNRNINTGKMIYQTRLIKPEIYQLLVTHANLELIESLEEIGKVVLIDEYVFIVEDITRDLRKVFPKPDRVEIDVHLDLETAGFNKVSVIDGIMSHGARENAILECAISFRSFQANTQVVLDKLKLSDVFQQFLIGNSTLVDNSTVAFHINNGYSNVLHHAETMPIAMYEQIVVKSLIKACEAFGERLEEYSPRNNVVFRLVGKSTFFDMDYIQQQMPQLSMYLAHELKDISAFKNFYREANKGFFVSKDKVTHIAAEDVEQTVNQQLEIRKFFSIVNQLSGGETELKDVNDKLAMLLTDRK